MSHCIVTQTRKILQYKALQNWLEVTQSNFLGSMIKFICLCPFLLHICCTFVHCTESVSTKKTFWCSREPFLCWTNSVRLKSLGRKGVKKNLVKISNPNNIICTRFWPKNTNIFVFYIFTISLQQNSTYYSNFKDLIQTLSFIKNVPLL